MKSEKAKARRVMADTIVNHVLPQIRACGFRDLTTPKEPIPMWHLHRPRKDGGFDAISIIFDKKRRPLFDAEINVIDVEGVHQPWGEFIEASKATASTPMKRILIKRKHSGALARILPFLYFHSWFGFRPSDSDEANRSAAIKACEEFLACLAQAENWWASRELGPNLAPADLGDALGGEQKTSERGRAGDQRP